MQRAHLRSTAFVGSNAVLSRRVRAPRIVRQFAVAAELKVGENLKDYPDYYRLLKTHDGDSVALANFKGQKPVVLFFYPKAATPGCTKEACMFRDRYEQFVNAGVEVFGISSDDPNTQADFVRNNRLPYKLLTDQGNFLRKGFGIPSDMFGLLPGRQTYVIDKEGNVVMSFNDQFQPDKHIEEALQAIKTIA